MSIVFLATFEDATPASANTWTEYDSANVPNGAEGVILRVQNINTTNRTFACRRDISTDDRQEDLIRSTSHSHGMMFFVGCNPANGIFEVEVEHTTDILVELLGYITEDSGFFFTNCTQFTPALAATWEEFDLTSIVSIQTGDVAVAAFFEVSKTTIAGRSVGIRHSDSTDELYEDTLSKCGMVVGLGSGELFDLKVENLSQVTVWCQGYMLDGITWRTNATSLGDPGDQNFTDRTFHADAIAGIFRVEYQSELAFRKNGSTEDVIYDPKDSMWAIVECDGSGIAEYRRAGAASFAALHDMGYFTTIVAGAGPSAAIHGRAPTLRRM